MNEKNKIKSVIDNLNYIKLLLMRNIDDDSKIDVEFAIEQLEIEIDTLEVYLENNGKQ